MMHITPSFNENISDLYSLRDKLLGFRNSIKSSPYVASTPYCRIQIDIWEDMMRLVDSILKDKPKLTKLKDWKIGDLFYSSRFPDAVYTIVDFPSYHSIRGEADDNSKKYGIGIPLIIEEHESLCFPYTGKPPKNTSPLMPDAKEDLLKSIKKIEREDNLKRKNKNKPEKEKKKFKIGTTPTEKKKGEKKAKKHLKNESLSLFNFKKDKKDKKKKKHKKK